MIKLTYNVIGNPNFLKGLNKLDSFTEVSTEQLMTWLNLSDEIMVGIAAVKELVDKAPEKAQDIFKQEWEIKSEKIELAHAIKAGLNPKELRAVREFIAEQWGS